jgi:hypothetical protein
VLWLKSRGLTHAGIAELADVSPRSIQRYLDEFEQGGLDRVRRLGWPGKTCELDGYQQSLEDYFLEHPQRPRGPAGHQAADRHPPRPFPGPRLLEKKVGLGWRKVGTVPAKADHEGQAGFLNKELLRRLEQAQRGQRTALFVDAAHFVCGPFLGYLWCLVRLFVPGPSGHKRYNVLAALDAITRRVIRVSNHAYINAESVCALLRQVAAAGLIRPVMLVLDNARYQKCAVVKALAASLGGCNRLSGIGSGMVGELGQTTDRLSIMLLATLPPAWRPSPDPRSFFLPWQVRCLAEWGGGPDRTGSPGH